MSFPSFSVGEVLTAADMNAVGLWKITNFTISSSGGTAATLSNGVVSIGNGNTTVTLSNVFSSDFRNYVIIGSQIVTSTGNNIRFNFNPHTGTEYYNGSVSVNATGGTATVNANNLAYWQFPGGDTGSANSFSWTIYNPNTTDRKAMSGHGFGNGTGYYCGGQLVLTTAQTGCTFALSTGTYTSGQIRVYGYRN